MACNHSPSHRVPALCYLCGQKIIKDETGGPVRDTEVRIESRLENDEESSNNVSEYWS